MKPQSFHLVHVYTVYMEADGKQESSTKKNEKNNLPTHNL